MAQTYNYPSGIILIFQASCPSGWTRFSGLDGGFMKGASAFSSLVAAVAHVHSVNPPSTNTGTHNTGFDVQTQDGAYGPATDKIHYHTMDRGSEDTDSATPAPPYINVIFCKKD